MLSGSFTLQVVNGTFELGGSASLFLFNRVKFDAFLRATFTQSGLIFSATLSLNGASRFVPFDNCEIAGDLTLEVNTTEARRMVFPRPRFASW